ncbi:hypothetical protein OAR16_00350 [bacterium]|nr:hypothetical protein [bacterium]
MPQTPGEGDEEASADKLDEETEGLLDHDGLLLEGESAKSVIATVAVTKDREQAGQVPGNAQRQSISVC